MTDLAAYLKRIGFEGTPRTGFDTLTRLHRGHLQNIPYENLDVLLKRTVDFDIERIFDKLVTRRRGGWCYEMNGLLAWALEEIGFDVTRLAGGVMRESFAPELIGNHLVLLVALDQPYLADVGFGDGLFEPVPLREGAIEQHGFASRLELVEGGWWRFHNHQNGGAPNFDFRAEPAELDQLARVCTHLKTSEASPFTRNVVMQRRFADRVELMRNSIRLTAHPDRLDRRVMADADEMLGEMRAVFGVEEPAARTLWDLADMRGKIMLADNPL